MLAAASLAVTHITRDNDYAVTRFSRASLLRMVHATPFVRNQPFSLNSARVLETVSLEELINCPISSCVSVTRMALGGNLLSSHEAVLFHFKIRRASFSGADFDRPIDRISS